MGKKKAKRATKPKKPVTIKDTIKATKQIVKGTKKIAKGVKKRHKDMLDLLGGKNRE